MKKKIMLLVAVMCISLCACGTVEKATEEVNVEENVEESVEKESVEEESVEEENVIESETEAEITEEIVELTAEEKYDRAKAFMKSGDLEDALSLLKEIESEIPEVTEWISVCEKYIPYYGIWVTDDYIYDLASSSLEPTPESVDSFVQIFIDCESSLISANIFKLNIKENNGEICASLGSGAIGMIVDDLFARYHSDGEYMQTEITFDFTNGKYVEIVTPTPENTAMKGTNICNANYIKSEKTIKDYNTLNMIRLWHLKHVAKLENPCDVLDNCWYIVGYKYDKTYKFCYRLSNDEQIAKEKFEQYISETLSRIELGHQYEIMEDGSVHIWDKSQDKSVDKPCETIYIALNDRENNFCLVVEIEEEIEIAANKPKEPKIGMKKEEVLKSTWGKPDDKNITEFSWGTEEQWVYKGKGYIYLENGVVTAIQHK